MFYGAKLISVSPHSKLWGILKLKLLEKNEDESIFSSILGEGKINDWQNKKSTPKAFIFKNIDVRAISSNVIKISNFWSTQYNIERFSSFETEQFPYVFTIEKKGKRIDEKLKSFFEGRDVFYQIDKKYLMGTNSIHSIKRFDSESRGNYQIEVTPIFGINKDTLEFSRENKKAPVHIYELGRKVNGKVDGIYKKRKPDEEESTKIFNQLCKQGYEKKKEQILSKRESLLDNLAFEKVFGVKAPTDKELKNALLTIHEITENKDRYELIWHPVNRFKDKVPQSAVYNLIDAKEAGIFEDYKVGTIEIPNAKDPVLIGTYRGLNYPICYWK